jgi:hypothetical protein
MNLATLVFAALSSWAPNVDKDVCQEVAQAVTNATQEVRQGPRFALELAALAVEESRLAPWVLDGSCNSHVWRISDEGKRLMRVGDCDGGNAFGAWQVRTDLSVGHGIETAKPLNLRQAALIVAHVWVHTPQAWSPWRKAKVLAARIRL